MNPNDRIFELGPGDIRWPFSSSSEPELVLLARPGEGWNQSVPVDPFPCYSHPRERVLAEVTEIEAKLPLPQPPRYFLLSFEPRERTNGWANFNNTYVDPNDTSKYEPRPIITLCGKRIPLHPAMTRYLVAHEYGHIAHYSLALAMGIDSEEFAKRYARDVRKIDYSAGYGGGRWHTNTGEIIANDIRIALLGKEPEFWPHDVTHPWALPEIAQWWRAHLAKHFVRNLAPVPPVEAAQ